MLSVSISHEPSPCLVPLPVHRTETLQVSGSRWVQGRATVSRPSLRLFRQPRTRIEPLDAHRQGLSRLLTAFQGVTHQERIRPVDVRQADVRQADVRQADVRQADVRQAGAWNGAPSSRRRPPEVISLASAGAQVRAPELLTLPDSLRMAAVASQAPDFGPRHTNPAQALHLSKETHPMPSRVHLQGEGFLLWYTLPPEMLGGKTVLPLALEAGRAGFGIFCSTLHPAGVQAESLDARLVELTPVVLVQRQGRRELEPLARMVDAATRDDVLKHLAWQQPRELGSLMLESTRQGGQRFSGQGTGREALDIQVEEASWLTRLSGKASLRPLLGVLETGMPVGGLGSQVNPLSLATARVGRLSRCILPERMHRGLLPEQARPEKVVLFPQLEVLVPLRSV